MHVYIFGAGSSLGAQPPNLPAGCVAPLVDELFAKQYESYAVQVGLTQRELADLRAAVGTAPVEEWLTRTWGAIQQLREVTSKASAHARFGRIAFYIWRLFLGISATYQDTNLFRVFLDKLVSKDVPFGLISFNYDTCLDQSVEQVLGVPLTNMEDYRKANVIKPHGSVNWIAERPRGAEPTIDPVREWAEGGFDYAYRFDLASNLMFNGTPIRSWDQLLVIPPRAAAMRGYETVFRWVHHGIFYPLVLLPLTTKMYDFMPALVPDMIERAQRLLARADEVYVVGYRARDEIFAGMLEPVRPGTHLHVIGRGSVGQTSGHILQLCPRFTLFTDSDQGFRGFVETGMRV